MPSYKSKSKRSKLMEGVRIASTYAPRNVAKSEKKKEKKKGFFSRIAGKLRRKKKSPAGKNYKLNTREAETRKQTTGRGNISGKAFNRLRKKRG